MCIQNKHTQIQYNLQLRVSLENKSLSHSKCADSSDHRDVNGYSLLTAPSTSEPFCMKLYSVCVCVCLLSHISLLEHLFVLKTLSRTQQAIKVKKFVAFSLTPRRSELRHLLHCTAAVQSAIFLSAKYTRALLKCHVDSGAEFGQVRDAIISFPF